MWLLDTTSLALTAFFDDNTPYYAILSHTWGPEEVSFQDIQGQHLALLNRAGYCKIRGFCSKAQEAGFQYGWVDTCCIDKTNNAELSEAINSMYRWYSNAVTCYAYLADVSLRSRDDPLTDSSPLNSPLIYSRWFERGWTLQELIAPPEVMFFDTYWNVIGTRANLAAEIKKRTRIPTELLKNETSLREHCVAEIISWAAGRKTTREEDRAYSLLGLFGVYMPLLYGEGDHAFIRLQLEIIKSTTDHSIFASDVKEVHFWDLDARRAILTPSIDDFTFSGDVCSLPALDETTFEMTNLGLRITLPCYLQKVEDNGCRNLLAFLNCKTKDSSKQLSIRLREASGNHGKPLGQFYRCGSVQSVPPLAHYSQGEIHATPLYIIQPTYGHLLKTFSVERSLPCSLDYSNLVRAGYLVEWSHGSSKQPLHKDGCKIIFDLVGKTSNSPLWITIFKHASKSTRFWVLLGLHCDKLGCRIESNSSKIAPPGFLVDGMEHQYFTLPKSLLAFDHAIEQHLDGGEIVRLTSQRALVLNRAGHMMKITLHE